MVMDTHSKILRNRLENDKHQLGIAVTSGEGEKGLGRWRVAGGQRDSLVAIMIYSYTG